MGFDHEVMVWVQSLYSSLGSLADGLFTAFTFLGEETFLLVMVFGIYWCFNKRLGEYLMLSLYASIGANGVLKDLVRRPRPFLTPGFEDVRYVAIETPLVDTVHLKESFSFPSGHSQWSAAFFGGLSFWRRRWGTSVLCCMLVLAVMCSRLYLGVHFPTDVLMGAALGLGFAALSSWLFRRFYRYRLWMFVGAVGITLLGLLNQPTPDTVKTIGVGVGALVGFAWEQRVTFEVEGTTGRRLLRLALGLALILLARAGLKVLFPAGLLFDGLRYGIVGFLATGLWPWLFTRMKL